MTAANDGPAYAPERACRIKHRYPSQEDAYRVAAKCFRDRGTWLRPYACTECQGWHLTHQRAAPANENWRPPALPAADRAKPEHQDSDWRRRRGSRRTARRYGR